MSNNNSIKNGTNETFGGRLGIERKRLKLTQEELGKLLGVSRSAQIKYESNEYSPGADYMAGLHRIGIDVMYLLTGERSKEGMSIEHRNLLDAYDDVSPEMQRAALAMLIAGRSEEVGKARRVPNYYVDVIKHERDLHDAAFLKNLEFVERDEASESAVKQTKKQAKK